MTDPLNDDTKKLGGGCAYIVIAMFCLGFVLGLYYLTHGG